MYKFIYLSHILDSNTPTFGDEDKVEIKPKSEIRKGDTVNMFSLQISNNHIGTHIDLPKHFFDTKEDVGHYDSSTWYFRNVATIEISRNNSDLISSANFPSDIDKNIDLLLIRTGYEKYRKENKYWNDNPGLSSELADYLRRNFPKLRAVGFDFISLTSWKHKEEGLKAHLSLLDSSEGEIFIIEDMKLQELDNCKIVDVIVAPWLIDEIDSAPVTIIARVI